MSQPPTEDAVTAERVTAIDHLACSDRSFSDMIACPQWCSDGSVGHKQERYRHDQNCWGLEHPVILHLEHNGPAPHLNLVQAMEMDSPRISPSAYRKWHNLSIVYLHLYRPHENKHLDLDTNFKLTSAEARQLAAELIAVADEIEFTR